MAVEQQEKEEKVPDQRAHEWRTLCITRTTQANVLLLGLVEADNEEPLEAVGNEPSVRLVDHSAEVPHAIADVLRDEGGLHDELEDDPDREGNATPVEEVKGNVEREERRVAEIEQHEQHGEEVVADDEEEEEDDGEDLLQSAQLHPLLGELEAGLLEHVEHLLGGALGGCVDFLFDLARVHNDLHRQQHVQPLHQLEDGATLCMVLSTEDVQVVLLQAVPLDLCVSRREKDYDQTDVISVLVLGAGEVTRVHHAAEVVLSDFLRLLAQ